MSGRNQLQRKRECGSRKKSEGFLFLWAACAALLILIAVFAPVLSPHDPGETDLSNAMQGISMQYPLGTDPMGRCMLSRVLFGGRISIFTALFVTVLSCAFGTVLGSASGFFGGSIDIVLNQWITVMQSFPRFILLLVMAGLSGGGWFRLTGALLLVQWIDYARLSRNFAVGMRSRGFVHAARLCGESGTGILFRHIIPNLIGPLLVNASLGIGGTIMEISALSYLGIGISSDQPEWGAMIQFGKNYLQKDIWLVLIPGIAVFLAAASFHLLGESLRDRIQS